jgi:hypothetical protein
MPEAKCMGLVGVRGSDIGSMSDPRCEPAFLVIAGDDMYVVLNDRIFTILLGCDGMYYPFNYNAYITEFIVRRIEEGVEICGRIDIPEYGPICKDVFKEVERFCDEDLK